MSYIKKCIICGGLFSVCLGACLLPDHAGELAQAREIANRKEQRVEMVNDALACGLTRIDHGGYGHEFDAAHAEIVRDLQLVTGKTFRVWSEHNNYERHRIFHARCGTCLWQGSAWIYNIGPNQIVASARVSSRLLQAMDASEIRCRCGESPSAPLAPIDRLVDGLTVRQCHAIYLAHQRLEGQCNPDLTASQKAAASDAWSRQLHAKVDAAKEKERNQVVCDCQEYGE